MMGYCIHSLHEDLGSHRNKSNTENTVKKYKTPLKSIVQQAQRIPGLSLRVAAMEYEETL